MAGPYNIPVVTYTGTDPDPVEWANDFIKPAIDDLDTRVGAGGTPLLPHMATLTPPVSKWVNAVPVNLGSGGQAFSTSQCYAMKFTMHQQMTIDRLVIEIVTGVAASSMRVGLYSDLGAAHRFPDALLVDFGTIPTTASVSYQELSITSRVLSAGVTYWLAWQQEGGGATVRAVNGDYGLNPRLQPGEVYQALTPEARHVAEKASTPGSFPATWSGTGYGSPYMLALGMRRSA